MNFLVSPLWHSSIRTFLRGVLRYLFGRRGERRVMGLRLYYRARAMVMLHSAEPMAKLTRVPEVRLWVDGAKSFRRIEKLLRRARHTIVIQMFLWVDDVTGRRIASVLLEAADRGIQVQIIKDAVGDIFEVAGDFLGTRTSPHDCWKRFWTHPNIRISYDTHHDHAKVYVIDDETLLLTGMNIADDYRTVYHDYLVELRGRRFVEQYLSRRTHPDGSADVELIMNTEQQNSVRSVLMRILSEARESVVVEHGYVSDPAVIDALLVLMRRNVRVTVIMPDTSGLHYYANMSALGQLLSGAHRGNLRVFLYPGRIHAKVLLIDHDTVFIGSANLIRSSLDEMGEVNVLIRRKWRMIRKLRDTFREDILRSRPLYAPPSFLWMTRWLAWLGL